MGARGVGQDGGRQLRGVVRALDVRGRLAERDVDQRLVLGAGGVLLVRPPRPDRLADDAHPAVGVLAHEGGEHGADDAAGVAARDGHVAQPDARHLLGRQRLAQQLQVPARHGDEHGFVALAGPRARSRARRRRTRRRSRRTARRVPGCPARRLSPPSPSRHRALRHHRTSCGPSRGLRGCAGPIRTPSRKPILATHLPEGRTVSPNGTRPATEGYETVAVDTPIPPGVSAPYRVISASRSSGAVRIVRSGVSRSAGTSQLTSNSRPSGSWA